MKIQKVSILMTIFNHENYLKSSIKSLINQNYKNWELIAIDNGSTDKSALILKSFKDKRIKKKFLKKNIGRTECLNFGLKFCKSKFIAILDSDDISEKSRLRIQVREMNSSKNLGLVFSDFEFINEKSKIVKLPKTNFNSKKDFNVQPRQLLSKNFIPHSSIMFRSNLIKKIGNYPKNFKYAQDYAFYLKILKISKIKFINKSLVKLRIPHQHSETFRNSSSKIITLELLKILILNLMNFKTSFFEKLSIFFAILLNLVKFCTPSFFINLKNLIYRV